MLELRICGGVEVEVDGRLLPESLIGGRQGRLVLAYLVCERERAVRREELADLLWADQLPDSWSASLSAVISRLRRLFAEAGLDGSSVVTSAAGTYQLDLPADSRVDLEDLAGAVGEAEDAAARGDVDHALATAAQAETVAARGFLADDCEWVDVRRDAIRDLGVRAAIAESTAHLLAGAAGRAIEAARRALDLDEMKEASYRQLMLALAAAGERAEALRVWERCRITLVEELGVDPSPETEAVYLRLLDASPPAPVTTELPSGVVTFLLTDIVESSALWEEHAAAMATALERHDAIVGTVVTEHGGTLLKSKLEGDATVSVFARATEGAAAALALLDAIDSEPWPEGARPRLRMAMHTGEAFERGGDYFGPALNRAARLRGLAVANEVLLSQAVAELVRDHLPDGVTLRDRGLQSLRGLSRGENVYELTRIATDQLGTAPAVAVPDELARPPVPGALAGTGPFVGRGDEVARLEALWQRAAAGEAGSVFVGGEPGVGKSRLAGEIAQRAHDTGGLVLYGRCDEDLAAPLQPFIEAVRALAPVLGATRLRAIRGIDELTRVVPDLTGVLGETPASRADPDTERLALFDAVTQLLATASIEAPLLLVLDDLHWAGKSTLSLLRHMLRGVRGSRVLVVGTYRDTELARTHPLAETLADLRRDPDTHRVTLGGLAPEDVAAYLAAIGNTDRALGRELAEVTAGNPFFLIEVVRHVEESGGSWQPGNLPEGVREATGRRLSRLSAAANDALSVAAVVGTTFDLALVEQVRGVDLVDPIGEAVHAGLVVDEPGAVARFRFAHAIVRQVLLSELVSLKRVRLHRTIAELLEVAPAAADPDARLADLAYHWFECASAGSADRAVTACRKAGDRAMERLAYEEAGDRYGMALQALEWVENDDAAVGAELHLARCDALLTAGDVAGARDAIDALEVAAAGSERLAAWYTTYEGLLAVLGEPDRLTEIVRSIGAAAGAMRDVGDLTGEAKARYVHASALERLGQLGAAERALDAALAAARSAGDRRLADAILAEAPPAALWGPSPVTRASGRCLDVVRVLRITSGTPAVEAVALRCQAVLEALRGRMDAARRMIGSSRRTVEQLGLVHRRLEADLAAGFIELLDGQAAAAEEHLRAAYEGLRERGLGGEAAQAGAFLGRALLLQGRVDEADAVAADAEALAGSDLKAAITWRDVRAEAAARRGDTDRALTLAREAVELASTTDALLLVADARLTLAAVLRATGDVAAADAEARRAVEACETKGATTLAALARAALGEPATASSEEQRATVMAATGPTENLATAASIRFHEAFNRGDWDAVRAAGKPGGAKIDDRRPIVGMTSYGDTGQQLQPIHAGGGRFDRPEVLATRGDRVELSRWLLRNSGMEVPFLAIRRLDADGLLAEFVMFEPESLDEAMATLDEMASATAFENDATRNGARIDAAYRARDWDAVAACLADGFINDDRRSIVGRSLDPLQSIASTRWIFDGNPEFDRDVVGTRGRSVALSRLTLRVPDPEAIATVLTVNVVDDSGRHERTVMFDADDPDAAFAELDRAFLEGEGAEHADVIAPVTSLLAALGRHDLAAARDLLAPDFVARSHRAVLRSKSDQGPDEWLQGLLPDFDVFGAASVRAEHVAHVSRDGGLWATVMTGESAGGVGFEVAYLLAVRVAGRRIAAIDVFDEHDVDAARAVLESTHIPDRPTPNLALAAALRVQEAFNRGDWEAVDAEHAPGWSFEDRRPIVGMTLDGGMQRSGLQHVHAGGERFDPPELLATRGDRIALHRSLLRGPGHETPFLAIRRVDADGLLAEFVMFEPESLDEAMAALDEMASATAFENDATRTNARGHAAFRARDWDAFAACHADGWINDDRRSIVGRLLDPQQSIANLRWIFDGGGTFGMLPIATRGRSLALARFTLRVPDPEATDAVLMVNRVDDAGKNELSITFDVDDLDGALAEMDRLFLEGEGAEHADVIGVVAALLDACDRRDAAAVAAVLAPGFVARSHRSIRTSNQRTATEFLSEVEHAFQDTGRPLAVAASVLRVDHVTRLSRDGGVWAVTFFGELESGGPFAFPMVFVVRVADGLIGRFDSYDDVDASVALAAVDAADVELEADASGNLAWRAVRRTTAAVRRRDWEGVTAALDSAYTYVDNRKGFQMRFEGDDALDMFRVLIALDDFTYEQSMLATRGERLVLVRSDTWFVDGHAGPSEVECLTLVECGPDGRVTARSSFDVEEVDAAYSALDARHAELNAEDTGNVAWRCMQRAYAALNRRDWEGFAATLDPAFTYVNGRKGVQLRLEGDDALEMFRVLLALDDFRHEASLLAMRGDRLVLLRNLVWFVDGQAGPSEVDVLNLVECGPDGRVTLRTVFDVEEVDAAYAALDARHAEFVAGEAGNTAWRCVQRATAAENGRDWDGFAATLDPAHVYVDRRRGVQMRLEGDDALELFRILFALDEFRVDRTLVATRGERLVLVRNRVWFVDGQAGPSEVESLGVIECGSDGRVISHTGFDPDDYKAAYAALDARDAEIRSAEPRPNLASRVIAEQDAAFARRDREAFFGLFAPDYVAEDRRPLMGRVFTVDESVASARYAFDIAGLQWTRRVDATRGERLALVAVDVMNGDDDDVEYEVQTLTLVELDGEGLIVRNTVFAPDARADAIAALDARAGVLDADPLANSPNRASRAVE